MAHHEPLQASRLPRAEVRPANGLLHVNLGDNVIFRARNIGGTVRSLVARPIIAIVVLAVSTESIDWNPVFGPKPPIVNPPGQPHYLGVILQPFEHLRPHGTVPPLRYPADLLQVPSRLPVPAEPPGYRRYAAHVREGERRRGRGLRSLRAMLVVVHKVRTVGAPQKPKPAPGLRFGLARPYLSSDAGSALSRLPVSAPTPRKPQREARGRIVF